MFKFVSILNKIVLVFIVKNLIRVYNLFKDLKTTIFNQDITTISNIVRFKIKREQTIQSRTHQTFYVKILKWEKNHVSPLFDKDHVLKLDIQTVARLSQSKYINSMI